jgi:hypothetical protein
MRGVALLKFKTPQIVEGLPTEPAFKSLDEFSEILFDNPAIDRPRIMVGAAILRADMVTGVPANEKKAGLGCPGELEDVATFSPVSGGTLENRFLDNDVGLVNLEPIPAIGAGSRVHPKEFSKIERVGGYDGKNFAGFRIDNEPIFFRAGIEEGRRRGCNVPFEDMLRALMKQ